MGNRYKVFSAVCLLVIAVLVAKDIVFGLSGISGQATAEATLEVTQQQLRQQQSQVESLLSVKSDLEDCRARIATCEDGRLAQVDAKEKGAQLIELRSFLTEYSSSASKVKQDVKDLNRHLDRWLNATARISVEPKDLERIKQDYELDLSALRASVTEHRLIVRDNQDLIAQFPGLELIPDESLTSRLQDAQEDLKKFNNILKQMDY